MIYSSILPSVGHDWVNPTTLALFSNTIIDEFSLEVCFKIRATIKDTAGGIVDYDMDNKLSYSPFVTLFLVLWLPLGQLEWSPA